MKIKGIKRGKTIETLEEINVPDGAEVLVEIQDVPLVTEEEQRQRLKELFTIPLEDKEEWLKIGEELDRDRRADFEKQQPR